MYWKLKLRISLACWCMHVHTHKGEKERQRQKQHRGPIQEFQHLTNWSLGRQKGENGKKEIIKEIIQDGENWRDWNDRLVPKSRTPMRFLEISVFLLGGNKTHVCNQQLIKNRMWSHSNLSCSLQSLPIEWNEYRTLVFWLKGATERQA